MKLSIISFKRSKEDETTYLLRNSHSQDKKDRKEIKSALKALSQFEVSCTTLNSENEIQAKVQVLQSHNLLGGSKLPKRVDEFYTLSKKIDEKKIAMLGLLLFGFDGRIPENLFSYSDEIASEAKRIESGLRL